MNDQHFFQGSHLTDAPDASRTRSRALIIGGGPAGLIAAEVLLTRGHHVELFEQQRSPGRKFLLAGRSGLNLTHSEPLEKFVTRYDGTCAELIREAVRRYPPSALQEWATRRGQETIVGSSGRVFPLAWRATPLLRSWLQHLGTLGLMVHTGAALIDIDSDVDGETPADRAGVMATFADGREPVRADAVVLALGGGSWPGTGSTGAWQELLRSKLVDVDPLRPANAGIRVEWSPVFAERFAGVPIKHVTVRAGDLASTGDVVVTKTGLQGGPVYSVSSRLSYPAADPVECDAHTLFMDLRPDETVDHLATRLAKIRRGDSFSSRLRKCGLSDVASGLVAEHGGRQVTHDPRGLALLIKGVPVQTAGLEPIERAISSTGGVTASAIDDQFMLHRLPGVFVAGEMVDWSAPTGGYLLQGCFSNGWVVADAVDQWMSRVPRVAGQG